MEGSSDYENEKSGEKKMLSWIYLITSCICMASSGLLGGTYTRINGEKKGITSFYTLLYMIAAVFGWGLLYMRNFSFEPMALIYSAIFGVCFAGANIAIILSVKNGPVSLTNLVLQLALIATALWGIFFWGSPWNLKVALGLLLVGVSLGLILLKKGKGEKITFKWMIFAFSGFLFNAGCAISLKAQQIAFDGAYGEMTMFFAVVISMVICLIWCLIDAPETPKTILKKSGWLPVVAGSANVLHNLTIILLASSSLSPSLIYPTLAVGGIGINAVASWVLLKEKLSIRQWAGLLLGAVAAVLLSL